MLETNFSWTSTGSSGALAAIELAAGCQSLALYAHASTIASTQSYSLQTAPSSGGPWATEASTSIGATANAEAVAVLRLSGPTIWARPYLNSASTGTYRFRLIACS